MLQRKEVKDLFDKESLSKFYMYELQKVFCTAPDVKSFPNLVELIERWTRILLELKYVEHIRILLSFLTEPMIRNDDPTNSSIFTDGDLNNLFNLLPIVEKILSAGLLNETMELFYNILDRDKLRKEIINMKFNFDKKEKYYMSWLDLHDDLEVFHQAIEDLWHPKTKRGEDNQIRAKINKEKAISLVYNDSKQQIIDILESKEITKIYKNDYKKVFKMSFDFYIDLYVKIYNSTPNGHIMEKRAPRSEESKRRSREGALNARKSKKQK